MWARATQTGGYPILSRSRLNYLLITVVCSRMALASENRGLSPIIPSKSTVCPLETRALSPITGYNVYVIVCAWYSRSGQDNRLEVAMKIGTNRRRLLQSLTAGSGAVFLAKNIPERWARPIIEIGTLPVHAVTSGAVYSATGLLSADESPGVTSCATIIGDEVFVAHQGEGNSGRREGLLPINGQDGALTLTPESTCAGGPSQSVTARIISISDSELIYEIDHPQRPSAQFQLPRVSSCVTFPPLCP